MFTAPLIIAAKTWKKPKCLPIDEMDNRAKSGKCYNGILVGLKKEGISDIHCNMCEP
jgi:hypothetical protein